MYLTPTSLSPPPPLFFTIATRPLRSSSWTPQRGANRSLALFPILCSTPIAQASTPNTTHTHTHTHTFLPRPCLATRPRHYAVRRHRQLVTPLLLCSGQLRLSPFISQLPTTTAGCDLECAGSARPPHCILYPKSLLVAIYQPHPISGDRHFTAAYTDPRSRPPSPPSPVPFLPFLSPMSVLALPYSPPSAHGRCAVFNFNSPIVKVDKDPAAKKVRPTLTPEMLCKQPTLSLAVSAPR